MRVCSLKLNNFRNYEREVLCFDEEINLLYGMNAQGKSNLLEAICYLGIASSFRGATESELIREGQPYFFLEAEIVSEQEGPLRITAAANRAKQRKWTVNREAKTRLSDLVGTLHVVVFAPEDVALVKAGPDARRRFLNRQMSQLDREYCQLYLRYKQVLRQRNALLKQYLSAPQPESLAVFSAELARLGARIIARRRQTLSQLAPLALDLHQGLSGGEQLSLHYESALCKEEAMDEAALEARFLFELKRLEKQEQLRGLTLVGPHRDDISILINGRTAREFASQGQQRSAALSMKLAELELSHAVRGEYPVLLLDDVLSELDGKRRHEVLHQVKGRAQTFISAVGDDLPLQRGRRFLICAGKATGKKE